jgi:nitrite reductase (NADH) small subunit
MSPDDGQRPLEPIDVGAQDEFALDEWKIVNIRGRSIGIVRTVAGFFAIRNRCPHQGAPLCAGVVTGTMLPSAPDQLSWGMEGEVVRCPWHGWEFDMRTGRSLFGVSRDRAAVYGLRVQDGRVSILMPVARSARATAPHADNAVTS